MTNSYAAPNTPLAQLNPKKLDDHSLHGLVFDHKSCNLSRNLAVKLGFHAPQATDPTPGQTTMGVAQIIPKRSDTTGHQSIATESPLIDTVQQQDTTHTVSPEESLGEIVAAKTLTVETNQSPPSRIPIPAGSDSLNGHTASAAGTIGEAVSKMRTSPHEIYLQVLITSLDTTDISPRETNHAGEPSENTQTPTHTHNQLASRNSGRDSADHRTTRERIYGVGVTAAVCQPPTQSAQHAPLSPERTAAAVLASFGTERSETGFTTASCDPSRVRERLETPDTSVFGTKVWGLIQASKLAPTEWLKRRVSLPGTPGVPRVCESDLSFFLGEAPTDVTHTGLGPGPK